MLIGFGDTGRHFSKTCTETFKKNVHNPKWRRPRFQQVRTVFLTIGTVYLKYTTQNHYQTQLSTTSAAQTWLCIWTKTRIVSRREIWGSSQNRFFSYNQRKTQSRAQTDIFGTYSTSFWKVGVFLSVRLPIIFRKVCTKVIKTIQYDTKRRRPRFRKNQKLFL